MRKLANSPISELRCCTRRPSAPLAELGFTKVDIRAAATAFGLESHDKPASPCLASRIPYGIEILLVVGHRHTIPQHRVMGEIDAQLMELVGWRNVLFVHGENNEK